MYYVGIPSRRIRPLWKATAVLCLVTCIRLALGDAELAAQEFKKFSREKVDPYAERASRLADVTSFKNYLELGVASLKADWEEEASDTLFKELTAIDKSAADKAQKDSDKAVASARYDAAELEWENAAQDAIDEELGGFRAQKETVESLSISESEYEAMIAEAEKQAYANPAYDIASFDQSIAQLETDIRSRFDAKLTSDLTTARANNVSLSGKERDAFDQELTRRESDLRTEFNYNENFYIKRARNRYIAVKRQDDFSARLAADSGSAAALGDSIIQDALTDLNKNTTDALAQAQQGASTINAQSSDSEISAAGMDWQKRMEAVITVGLTAFEKTEEKLYSERLVWLEETKRSRAEGETIWKQSHDELSRKREAWLTDVQKQIADGRTQWEQKIAEFSRSREAAEIQLRQYIAEEQSRYDASSKQLNEMVAGGGGALLEAKQAYNYYSELLEKNATPNGDPQQAALVAFYKEQRKANGDAIKKFQDVLAGAEGVLRDRMHSDSNDSGMLKDKRLFAGTLPDDVKNLSESTFKDDLTTLMGKEEFVLYRQDVEDLIRRNELFKTQTAEIESLPEFKYSASASVTDLAKLVLSLDRKYDPNKQELLEIVNRDRPNLTDADRLAAIKKDIADWFTSSKDGNVRLRRVVLDYFSGGLGGYHITGNDSDPYLMTQAEYDWELLRRQRNYLAGRMRQAAAVKEYADLAYQHEAGLEMSFVTGERATAAKAHADILEAGYLIAKGDISIDPAIRGNDAALDARIQEILSQRGVSLLAITSRVDAIDREISLLAGIAGSAPSSRDQVDALRSSITQYLAGLDAAAGSNVSSAHPLSRIQDKLAAIADLFSAGADSSTIAARWSVLVLGAQDLSQILARLKAEYDPSGLSALVGSLTTMARSRSPQEIQSDMTVTREGMAVNERALAAARSELDRAREAYRAARIDLDIISGSNASDLIRLDLTNTASALANVTNRMEKYAQIPGLLDAKSAREMDLIGSLSASEKAKAELQATETVISQVQGLEEAKKRSRDLDAFLSANPLAGKTALDAATLVLAQSSLVAEGSANAELNSFAFAAGTRGQLASVKSTIVSLNADLAQAISQNKSANEKEDIRAKIARAEEEAFKLIDSLFAQIHGEETMRREMVKQALDPAVASAQATILAKSVADARLSYGGESGDLSVVAVERLRTYLTGMRGREYSDLLTDLAGKISAPSSKTFDGYSGSASAVYTGLTSQEKDQAAWRFVRDFVMTNRSAFEKINSAPDSNDPRSVNRKWDDLFQSLSGLSDQASAKDDFASQIPSSNSSAWVVSYAASRQGLLARLAAVLSSGNVTASYAAMSGADREVLSAYGSADSLMDARQLSRNLEQIRSTISVEIASLPASYESVFRREKQKEYSNQWTASSLTLDGLRRDQSAVQTELYALYSENLTATGSRKTDIENRISELEQKANDLNAQLEPLQAQARHTAALLREASQSGSSVVPGATGSFYRDAVRIGMADYASRVFAQSRAQTPAAAATSMELVKGALGMVQTDASGTILRDNSGKPMVTAEFAALGVAADADLSKVFSGSMKGAELVRYAQRLDAYLKSGRTISPEVSTAISQMQSSLRDVAAAKLFIEQRDQTGTDLLANANAMQAHARALSEKYPQFAALETQISSALSGSSPVSAVLAVMEKEENVRLLYLFEGYNESFQADGVLDADGQKMADELRRFADDLRAIRLADLGQSAVSRYAAYVESSVSTQKSGGTGFLPDRNKFMHDLVGGFDPSISAVTAMAPAGIRAALWSYVKGLSSEQAVYAGEIVSVLSRGALEGDALKSAVLARLNASQMNLSETLARSGAVEKRAESALDLRVEKSVTDLMERYAQRGTTASAISTFVSTIADATVQTDAARSVDAKLKSDFATAELTSIRNRLYQIMASASSTTDMKSQMQAYLATITNPDAADIQARTAEVRELEMLDAIAASDSRSTYQASDYPEEMRQFVLVRQFNKAREMYANYLKLRASSNPSESSAGLDLSGLMDDFARSILMEDASSYVSSHSVSAFASGGDGKRTISDYIAGYLASANTDESHAGAGIDDLREKIAQDEYLRLKAQNVVTLDESRELGDFQTYIWMAKIQAYYQAHSVTLTGATAAEKRANLRAQFDLFLSDPAGIINGKTAGQRLLLAADRDSLFGLSYAMLESSVPLSAYLPGDLQNRVTAGKVNQAYDKTASDFLPADLKAISGYSNLDYRTMALALAQPALIALVLTESSDSLGQEDLSRVLASSDLDAVLARAGYANLPASAHDAVVKVLTARNLFAKGGSSTTDAAVRDSLRRDRIVNSILATSAMREDQAKFQAANQKEIPAVLEKVQNLVTGSSSALRTAVHNAPGSVTATLAGLMGGQEDSFFAAQSSSVQAEMRNLATALSSQLSAAEKSSLTGNVEGYRSFLDLQSASQMHASGIVQSFESYAEGAVLSGASAADRDAFSKNRSAVLTSLLASMFTKAGLTTSLSATVPPSLVSAIDRAAAQIPQSFLSTLIDERPLLERYMALVLESDSDRNEISNLLAHPELISPEYRLSIGFEIGKDQAILQSDANGLLTQLSVALSLHSKIASDAVSKAEADTDLGKRLASFASARGTSYTNTRFSSHRTFIGAELTYQQAAYDQYVKDQAAQGQPVVSFDVFSGGAALAPDSLGKAGQVSALLSSGDYENLTSDSSASTRTIQLGQTTADPTDDATIEVAGVRTVATVAERQSLGLSGDALYQELYYENLANNYIEAISRLNRSLVTVFRAADLADGRQADPNAILAQIQGAYDADAAGAVSIDGIVAIKQQAAAAMADNGSTQLSAKGSQIRAVEEQTEKAQFEYAEAGRRSEALKQSLAVYLEAAAKPARDAFDAAQKKFDDLTVVERSLRDQYGVQNREYVNRLDQMADAFKKFLAANEEAELRRGVAEYAKTPYLYQSSTANNEGDATLLEKHKADAKEAYELAQRALDDVQSRMKDAAFAVQTQDRLELFASIAGKLQAGTTFAPLSADDSSRLADLRDRQLNKHETLSAAEKTELDGLTERDLAERYADVFTARSEHILHTMRVVRLHKAQEIIKGEIEKRRAIAESQRQNFERVLAGAFPVNDSGKEARNAVYQRLAGIVEASGGFSAPALYNEYKSYFWSGQSWMQSFGGTYINASVQNLFPVKTPTVTISQQVEAAAGVLGAAMMPVEDQKAMAQYVAANGQLLDFAGFSGVYYSFLQALGAYDTANLTDRITKAVYIPAQYTGYAMTYAGTQMMAAGAAMLILGTPLIARGAAMVAAGGAMVRTATQMLVRSQMQLNFAQITALSMQGMALGSAGDTNIRKTMAAQQEYEKAQASLDYFTKIGDVETLKHRLIAFGSLRKDDDSTNALYTLTEDDLKYLVENGAAVDSTGASIPLTAQESSDALDGRTLQNDSEFRDSFGRRYSLTKPEITSPPGALSGGLYRGSDGDYVRVRRVNDAGAEYFAYAKLESGTGTEKTYDAGRVLDALTTQADDLRAQRKAAYIAAEDAAGSHSGDGTFALRERDSTYDMLFQKATGDADGGREYSGYRITYADVSENADLVYRDQLNQRLNVQLQDWDIRAQQLNDQKADWEDRVSTIISRGKDSWNLAENRFAAEQRKWESEQRIAEEEGKKHWEEKTKEILAKKLAFEEEMAVKKAQADANTNLSSIIDTLNAEISQFSQNTGIKKDSINKAEVLARIVDEIKSSVPTGANKLAELNSEVSKFNTRLEITELANSGNTQFDSKLASALANYDAELSDHAKNLRVLANVKVYQEYLALRNNIRQQIMDQNDSIDLQTQSAAAAAGFARSGASYIKRSAGGSVARIDAYVKMDADKAIRNAFGATGYEEMSDQSVTNLLRDSNETEVEAFFYTQKLRLQAASEQIFGSGTQEARRGSRDAKVIGSLGKWIGAAPDSATGGLATRAAGDSYGDDVQTRNIFTQYLATGGFGELGEYGSRPSGIAFGFYVQLQYLGEQLNQQDATVIDNAVKHANSTGKAAAINGAMGLAGGLTSAGMQSAVTRAATTGDMSGIAPQLFHAGQMGAGFAAIGALSEVTGGTPLGTFMNQYNPALMFANSSYNVRIGSQVNHISEGYLWEANLLNSIKAPLNVIGAGLIAGGWTAPFGVAVIALANSIQANPTTGERALKMTDQAAIATGVAVISALFAPGAGSALSSAVGIAPAAGGAIVGAATALAASGVRYDEEGTSQGWSAMSSHGDMHGEQVLLATGVGAVTGAVSTNMGATVDGKVGSAQIYSKFAQFAVNDAVSTALNVSGQYMMQQTLGAEHSSYVQLQRGPDLSRLGALLAGGIAAEYADHEHQERIEKARADYYDALKQGDAAKAAEAYKAMVALGAIGRRRDEEGGGQQWTGVKNDDFVKLLHQASAKDGRYGPMGESKSMEAAYKAGQEIARDVELLTADGSSLTQNDRMALCEKYHVNPADIFTAANAQLAAETYGRDYTGDYQSARAREAAAAQARFGSPIPSMGSWKDFFELSAAENETPAERKAKILAFNEQPYFYKDGVRFERQGKGEIGSYYAALIDGKRVTYTLVEDGRGVVKHIDNDKGASVILNSDGVLASAFYAARDWMGTALARYGEAQMNNAAANRALWFGGMKSSIEGPYTSGQILPTYPGGDPYAANPTILHFAVTANVIDPRPAQIGYYADPNLNFTTYAGHYPGIENARDLWNTPIYGLPNDMYVNYVATGNDMRASGLGTAISVSPVSDPSIQLVIGHVTEISADVLNAQQPGHRGQRQILPAGSFIGEATRSAGYQTASSPHAHLHGTDQDGARFLTATQILQLLRTGGIR